MTVTGQLEALRPYLNKLTEVWKGADPEAGIDPPSWKAVIQTIDQLAHEWAFICRMENDPAPRIKQGPPLGTTYKRVYSNGNLALRK